MERRIKQNLMVLTMVGLVFILFFVTGRYQDQASYHYEKAIVVSVEVVEVSDQYGQRRGQALKLRLTTGSESGKIVDSFNSLSSKPMDFDTILSPGDRVIVSVVEDNEVKTYYFSDFDRIPYFWVLAAIFVLGLIFFGRTIGLKSLIAIGISLIILWRWFIAYTLQPNINVYVLAAIFCTIISFVVLLVISGITLKTWAALLGSWGGLAFASLLSYLSIQLMHLTGIDTEEAFMLKANIAPFLDFHGVLFASMIIGSLGAIIDVTISIASAQFEIYQSSPEITWRELYTRGMNIGKDIMGAMSNTLILAYVGSSLPLLLMIAVDKEIPFERVLNLPFVITELVRALIGSIGLIYAIPLTALIMATFLRQRR